MNDKKSNTDFYNLSIRYLSGEAIDEEISWLEEKVGSDAEAAAQFREIKKTWQLSRSATVDFDTASAWEEVNFIISEEDKKENPYPFGAGRTKWVFTLRIAASIVVLIGAVYLLYTMFSSSGLTELTASGQLVSSSLEDGSEVTLNLHSRLSYDKDFNDKERRVKLIGSAFFDVVRNENKPFIVETPDMTIQVLGTSFYVDARENEDRLEVIVNSGQVSVSGGKESSIKLSAGERGILDKKTYQLLKEKNGDINYLAWKTKSFVFENTPLIKVIEDLEKAYHANIALASNLNDCRLTATYEAYELDEILFLIAETFNLELDGSGKDFSIQGEGCK